MDGDLISQGVVPLHFFYQLFATLYLQPFIIGRSEIRRPHSSGAVRHASVCEELDGADSETAAAESGLDL